MNSELKAPPASETTVLVTGGTGHLGGHIIAKLLRDGYQVRTTVRTKGRSSELLETLAESGIQRPERVAVFVADLASDSGWSAATSGVDYVLHVASPFPPSNPANDDEVILPARDGALRVLGAARDAGVRRVVMTSSFAAIGYSGQPDGRFTEEDWTDPGDENTAYIKSKTIAERAAWDFLRAEGGLLQLTVINPTGIFGPLLNDHLSTSVGLVKEIMVGRAPTVPRSRFGIVDVRDVADLHVLAMTSPDAPGHRFIATGDETSGITGITRTLAAYRLETGRDVPPAELSGGDPRNSADGRSVTRSTSIPVAPVLTISNQKAKAVLGWRPRSAEVTIRDTADSLLERGLVDWR